MQMIRKSLFPSLTVTLLFTMLYSCNTDELDQLRDRIAELENQGPVVDTVFIYQTDSVFVSDTVYVFTQDSLFLFDTLFIFNYDTIFVEETIILANDTILLSDLTISSQGSMDWLEQYDIKHIVGQFTIQDCENLTPLMGLKSVGGLEINTAGLVNLNGLDSLEVVNTDLVISSIEEPIDLSALNHVQTIGNQLIIQSHLPSHELFTELNDVSTIQIYVSESPQSYELIGFDKITEIETIDLTFRESTTISAFNSLRDVTGSIILQIAQFDFGSGFGDYYDVDLIGFQNLEAISEDFRIVAANITNAPESLISVGNDLTVLDNIENGFSSLDSVGKSLNYGTIKNSFQNLRYVGDLIIYETNDFVELQTVGGQLTVNSTGATSWLDLNLSSVSQVGGLVITTCLALENLSGFHLSGSIERLQISANPMLTDISSLSTITSVRNLFVQSNSTLPNLDGLENIVEITEDGCCGIPAVIIDNNSILDDFCGIKQVIDNIIGTVEINGNLSNPQSAAEITGCN